MKTDGVFADFDFSDFWDEHPASREDHVEPAPDDALVASIEAELGGYRLPAAYVELARHRNGGLLKRCCFPMTEPTNWADDHIMVTSLYPIGRTATYALCGRLGSSFMLSEWGYPPIGICIGDTPTAGHEQIMLDYRACGKQGEPQVVYVDQEDDYRIVFVARDFESFIKGLVSEDAFDTAEEDKARDLDIVARGRFSPFIERALAAVGGEVPEAGLGLRALARAIVEEKGFFALHADARSHRFYDIVFWLYSALTTAPSFEAFVVAPADEATYTTPCYERMIAFCLLAEPFDFCTGGYAKGFLEDWWAARLASGAIAPHPGGFRFTQEAERQVIAEVQSLATRA